MFKSNRFGIMNKSFYQYLHQTIVHFSAIDSIFLEWNRGQSGWAKEQDWLPLNPFFQYGQLKFLLHFFQWPGLVVTPQLWQARQG